MSTWMIEGLTVSQNESSNNINLCVNWRCIESDGVDSSSVYGLTHIEVSTEVLSSIDNLDESTVLQLLWEKFDSDKQSDEKKQSKVDFELHVSNVLAKSKAKKDNVLPWNRVKTEVVEAVNNRQANPDGPLVDIPSQVEVDIPWRARGK